MEIKDGTHIDYTDRNYPRTCIYSWGWIGNSISKSQNTLDSEERTKLIEKLKNVNKDYNQVTDHCMGHHTCEICGTSEHNFNGTVRILHENKLYCSPAGVHHYIEMHDYHPPQEALIALEKGHILSQKEWKQYNKDDKEYQEELKQRHEKYLKKREEEGVQI
ncbi:hypothetical protein D4R86_02235 [bacterium]|nr:MAG: hypothetical protein D4R86_02235 [bacterium]